MAGRPKTRAKRLAAQQNGNGHKHTRRNKPPKHQYLADIYAEKYTTFDALRTAMVQNGIVEHGINPYEVIQRAIDDTTVDYMLLRRQIDKDTKGNPANLTSHPLYPHMESMREAMVRYSTFAMQYDIQRRQLKLSETRVALLAATLRTVLTQLGLTHDQIKAVPRLLIEAIQEDEPRSPHGNNVYQDKLDPNKANALAEILANDAEVEVIDLDAE